MILRLIHCKYERLNIFWRICIVSLNNKWIVSLRSSHKMIASINRFLKRIVYSSRTRSNQPLKLPQSKTSIVSHRSIVTRVHNNLDLPYSRSTNNLLVKIDISISTAMVSTTKSTWKTLSRKQSNQQQSSTTKLRW